MVRWAARAFLARPVQLAPLVPKARKANTSIRLGRRACLVPKECLDFLVCLVKTACVATMDCPVHRVYLVPMESQARKASLASVAKMGELAHPVCQEPKAWSVTVNLARLDFLDRRDVEVISAQLVALVTLANLALNLKR